MRNRLTVALLLLVVGLLVLPPPAFAPTAVEYAYSAGPLGIRPGQALRSGLLLPAGQATVRVSVINGNGLLFQQELHVTPDVKGGVFSSFFDIFVDDRGTLMITDGTSNTVLGPAGDGQVAVLIGLLLPAVQKVREATNPLAASLQLVDMGTGQSMFALPYIERRHTLP